MLIMLALAVSHFLLWGWRLTAFAVWNPASHHRRGTHSLAFKAFAWKMTHISFTHILLTKDTWPGLRVWGCVILPQEMGPNIDEQ